MKNEDLVRGWIDLQYAHEAGNAGRDLTFFGRQIGGLAKERPEECLQVVVAILEKDSSDLIVSNVAAGPLENLIEWHGLLLISEIERISSSNKMFKRALGMVWPQGGSEEVWGKIEDISK